MKEHITDGTPCWCGPEVTYEHPTDGTKVIVHKDEQVIDQYEVGTLEDAEKLAIRRMAQEADIEVAHMNKPMTDAEVKQAWIQRFAALVAAHESEKATEYRLKLENVLAGCEAAVLAEREACAKVCEETPWSNWFQSDCAAAIRARGEK